MEGAAVAHICSMYGIPVIEIRGISNIIEDRDMKKWNIPLAYRIVIRRSANWSGGWNEYLYRLFTMSNDTFIFYALIHNKLSSDLEFRETLNDVETLNRLALAKSF